MESHSFLILCGMRAGEERAKASKNLGAAAIRMYEVCDEPRAAPLACAAAKHFMLAAEYGSICMASGWLADCAHKAKGASDTGAHCALL